MNQITNLLRSLLLIGCMLFLGCQADDKAEPENLQAKNTPILRKEFKEFENLPDLLSEILPRGQSISARGSNPSPLYNFEIDSTTVTEITNNGIVYYTLAVTREETEDGTFENLVVFDNGGEKKAVLVKYKPDASFLSRRETNPDAQFSGKINMTELNPASVTASARSTTATKCFVSTHKFCTNGAPGTLAGPGCYTSSDGGAHVKSVTTVNCFEVVVNEPQPYIDFSYVDPGVVSDGGGGNPEAGLPYCYPATFLSTIEFRFVNRLSPAQKTWWNSGNNNAAVAAIYNYLTQNTYDNVIDNEAKAIAIEFIQKNIDSELKFDFEKSLESPANIDFTGVDLNTPEGKKLDCIYKTIMTVPAFKNLFQNTFGSNERLNVKFEIADNLPSSTNGVCHMTSRTVNGVTTFNNLIRINNNILNNSKSDIFIARVILHEAIHAFLNVKRANCDNGATLPYLNNLQLGELIGTFYQGFNCHIDVNGSAQSQHDFIFNYMTPTFMDVLWGLKDKLISQAHQQQIANSAFYNTATGELEPFIWNDLFYNMSLAGLHETESFTNYVANDPIRQQKFNYYNGSSQLLTKNCN